MSLLLAQAAVNDANIHFDKLYSYRIPAELAGRVFPGSMVLVPFGRGSRARMGVVLACDAEPESAKLKFLFDVAPASACLTPELLRLVHFLKERTFCTYYEAVKAVIPYGAQYKPTVAEDGVTPVLQKQLVRHTENAYKLVGTLPPKPRPTAKQLAAVALLAGGERTLSALEEKGISRAVLDNLCAKGVLECSKVNKSIDLYSSIPLKNEPILLTEEQQAAYDALLPGLEDAAPHSALLYGVTGSGKTLVFLKLIEHCLQMGRRALVLVPEISLTPQMILRLKSQFGKRVAVQHSALNHTERLLQWQMIQDGGADIVVGTRSAIFSPLENIGLVIIDEEQRFGVKHKEKLKENFIGVDMLTLSATPIPRTLNMAMSGIRDLSTIEQPPIERQPVETFVLEYNDVILAEAMKKELARGGQVYYLHNRVDNIEACAAHVSQMVPGARVGIAHGKMTEEELNPVWQHLLNGEIDILVCTTLIETGIDVRNCNTLIIEDADRMGLAQLYQIRGRVGRSGRKAYAYFTFRRDKTLTDIAQKRLSAIREFTAFGSGFRIAMRDLQIRGAGSLLGHSQHGHMEAVGYDLYVKMLGQAIARARGEPVQRDKSDCLVDLRVDAFIPEKYIPDGAGRIEAYKRIAAIQTPEDAADVLDELIDRYGDPPPSVSDLVNVSLARVQATAVGVYEVTQKKDTLVLQVEQLDLRMIQGLLVAFNGRVVTGAGAKPYLSVTLQKEEKPLELLQSILRAMQDILKD